MMRNLNPLMFIAVLAVTGLGYAFYVAYQLDSKNNFIIIQGNSHYKTRKIDSTSNGSIYFRNNHGNDIIVTGNYIIINRNQKDNE